MSSVTYQISARAVGWFGLYRIFFGRSVDGVFLRPAGGVRESEKASRTLVEPSSLNLVVSGWGQHEAGKRWVVAFSCSRRCFFMKSRRKSMNFQDFFSYQLLSNSSLENGHRRDLVSAWPRCSHPSSESRQQCMKSSRSERPGLYLTKPSPDFSSSGQKVVQSFGIAKIRFSIISLQNDEI